jgi:DNA-binding Lrp family transcriptional regulator
VLEILRILEDDAKTNVDEIAAMLGLDEDTVSEKIKEMEEKGIIRRYKTVIDWEKAGVGSIQALIDIKVDLNRESGYDCIAERIAGFPEVQSVRLISGDYDLSIVVKGKTMKEVAYFVAEKIATLEQVRDTVTHFLLKIYKENGDIFYEKEVDRRLLVTP